MDDHHQVKTSFLFIQLQSPIKASAQTRPANTVCAAGWEERLSSDISRNESATVCDFRKPAAACLNSNSSDCLCSGLDSDRGYRNLEKTLKFPMRSHLDSSGREMSDASQTAPPARSGTPVSHSVPTGVVNCEKVNFLHSAVTTDRHETGIQSPGLSTEALKHSNSLTTQSLTNRGYISKAWSPPVTTKKDGIWWKVEVNKPTLVDAPIFYKSPESKTFTSAVIERSAQLTGVYKKTGDTNSITTSPVSQQPCTIKSVSPSPRTLQTAETFVWVKSTSPHAQSVAKAKYEFLFGKVEEATPSDSVSRGSYHLPPEQGSSAAANAFSEYGPVDGTGDEPSEQPMALANETGNAHILTILPNERQDVILDIKSEKPCRAARAPPTMISFNGASGEQLDMANQVQSSTDIDQSMETSSLKKPADLLLKSRLISELNTEVLTKDTVCSAMTMEKELVSTSGEVKRDRLKALSSQEKLAEILAQAELTSGPEPVLPTEGELGEGVVKETKTETPTAAAEDRQELEEAVDESCKILAEIPGIFTAFLDGAHIREKTPKKIRFLENKIDASDCLKMCEDLVQQTSDMILELEGEKECSTMVLEANGPMGSHEGAAWFEKSTGSDIVFPASKLDMGEDEVFGRIPEVNVESPESEVTPDICQARTNDSQENPQLTSQGEEATDVFSSQFESILESHWSKGTLHSSMESLDAPSSADESEMHFNFNMPLTPMIQQRIKESSRLQESTLEAGQHEILSVSTDSRTGEGYLEVTSSYLEVRTGSPLSNSKSDHILDTTSVGPVQNGVHEDVEDIKKDSNWLHNLLSDAGLKERFLEFDFEMGSTERLKGSTDTLGNSNRCDVEAARRLAKRLYNLEGFKRSDVAKHLGKNNDFSKLVAEQYLSFFDFTGMTLDQSLRRFLKAFALMGETQERERVLIQYSKRYYHCNPGSISSQDGVHCLTCALMLLNTDLHGHNIGKKMTCQEFITNLDGLNGEQDFPRDLLKALYNSIKNEKLEWAIDDDELKKSLSELADKSDNAHLKGISRIGSGSNPFIDISHDPNAAVYKSGFLARKIHADMDGKKTPRGKRGWKTFYAVLKGMILYLQKDEYKPEKALSEDDLKNAVSIHHALAIKATDYEKKPNVLKLKTADWRVFLFQAQTPEEMEFWIRKINSVAAMFSAPSFPSAIGSQKKFSRPLLPATTTRMSQEEQLKSHEAKLKHITTELAEHRSYPPDKKVKTKEIEEYRLKEHYLEFEENRYEMYVKLLKEGVKEILGSKESDSSGLKKSQSSPSLNQESSPASAKVKRNVSERKEYRPETPSSKEKVT
ncbi:PH and SEC7 domain-containing protein 2-like isoform X1 [Polyodon spathula]|uniref:PH and SEC7 domain-containing protein 2-like isoform X1 n=1 Tax=Polyodon spathula TaxID=7913 RepID=UPI001B7E7D30|nr:PH and SEC7 domain-containing protein 2-like isoform X1 [Polyodon spathula]